MIRVTHKGSFQKTDSFLKHMSRRDIFSALESYAQEGVQALSAATPVDSGLAASSWYYEVTRSRRSYTITWLNRDVENGFPVAIMLQYGYATGTGGYVKGQDYINPAIRPIFDKIAEKVWKEVTSA